MRDVIPGNNDIVPAQGAVIRVRFSREVDPESLAEGMKVFGRWSGPVPGTVEVSEKDRLVAKFTPDRAFSAGEQVFVTLASGTLSANGSVLRGFALSFWIESEPAGLVLTEVQELSARSEPSTRTQAFGGVGSDLNGDGALDIAIANEMTADLRVFLNDGSGTFAAFSEPTTPLDVESSPAEPADFDGDGDVDLAVANPMAGTVAVLLGNGDGTFAAEQLIQVGNQPRGLAVLDADQDGDIDIATANHGDDELALLRNDGSGQFGEPETFEGGGDGEWALTAADMDNDGRIDLVVGAQTGEQIIVNRNEGGGVFTPLGAQDAGGPVWMLVAGDLNGDRDADVAVANRLGDNGAILFGMGNGFLEEPDVHDDIASDPVASALADLDGDGDLDWVVSSLGGEWTVLSNRGNGRFDRDQALSATQAASSALAMDTDNDGVLELVLIDELEDTIKIVDNQ